MSQDRREGSGVTGKKLPRATPLHRLYSLTRRKPMGTATFRHLDLVTLLKVHGGLPGGEQNMLSEPKTSLPIGKCTRSSMALQVNSMGRVDIQVKMIRVEHDQQSVAFELHYGRHETDSSHATTWWKTYWKDSERHETHAVKMH